MGVVKGRYKVLSVWCKGCNQVLLNYRKKNKGMGGLVKLVGERIVEDSTKQDGFCNNCGAQFARPFLYQGKPAFKLLRGKIFVKRKLKRP